VKIYAAKLLLMLMKLNFRVIILKKFQPY